MGRGRQKAKHTKVAREMKDFSPETNYDALQRELTMHSQRKDTGDELSRWAEYHHETGGSRAEDEQKRA
jgi:Protein of unknown function (DUF3073)